MHNKTQEVQLLLNQDNYYNFIDFSSKDFSILEDYIQKQIDENTFEEKKVGQRFIINIP